MTEDSGSVDRQRGLRHAASVIFALVAIVPLLVFAYTLYSLDILGRTQAQAGLAVSLAISLLGYWLFRSLLTRMSENITALVKAIAQTNRASVSRPAAPPTSASAPPLSASALPASASAGAAAAASGAAGAVATSPFARGPADHQVTGLGTIREFGEMARMMDQLWHREATRYHGRRVRVSVANTTAPLVGVITDITDDGFYIEHEGAAVPVSYRRVQGIEGLDAAS